MKKIIALLLPLMMLCALCPVVLAEDAPGYTVLDSNWFVYDNGKDNKYDVWFFAEVRNDNDFSIMFKEGTLTVTDASGNQFGEAIKLSSGDMSYNCLAPGETGIIFKSTTLKEVTSADLISNVVFAAVGKQYETPVIGLKVEGKLFTKLDNSPSYGGDYYNLRIDATVSHDYDTLMFQPIVNVAVYDRDGRIIFAKRDCESNISVLPGNSTMIHIWTNTAKLGRVWAENGIEPATCKVTAFVVENQQETITR